MTNKLMALSYSRLSTYESCPRKFEYLYVLKSIKDSGSTATEYGTRVHGALENYGKALVEQDIPVLEGILELESEAKAWFPMVKKICDRPGEKLFEHQMAIRRDKTPCGWFDSEVWLRSIADVLVIDGKKAYCIDWKTGKKKDNPTQMQLFAAMVFLHYPEVEEVATSFVWLVANDMTNVVYQRRYADSLWVAIEPRLVAVQEAVDLGVFTAKPSGLCPWCPAQDICGDAKKGKRK
jgi:CRISPR/Cas system-associated exonuclease Cas4 (RecB family)